MPKEIKAEFVGKRLEVRTKYGTLVAQFTTDPDFPGIFLDFIAPNAEESTPIALLEVTNQLGNEGEVRLLVWDPSINSDDYDHEVEIVAGVYKEDPRICSECGKKMREGYCINDGDEYYCSDECANKHYTPTELIEMYYGVGKICDSDMSLADMLEWDEDDKEEQASCYGCCYWTEWDINLEEDEKSMNQVNDPSIPQVVIKTVKEIWLNHGYAWDDSWGLGDERSIEKAALMLDPVYEELDISDFTFVNSKEGR